MVSQFYDVIQPLLISVLDDLDKKAAEEAASDEVAVPDQSVSEEPATNAPLYDDATSNEATYDDSAYDDSEYDDSYDDSAYDDSYDDSFTNPIDELVDSSFFGEALLKGLESVLRDRTMAIELLHTEIKQVLVIAMVGLQSVTETKDPVVDEIFNNKSYVQADLYLDQDGKLRKMKTELNFVPPTEDSEGIQEVKLTFVSEHWKINEPIVADVIDTTDSYTADSISKPAEILSMLDPNSAFYHLLKDDLQITKKSIVLNMYEAFYTPYSMLPYIEKGVTMVPARFISEQLDADITFDPTTQAVTVKDTSNGIEIILTLESNKALLNGKSVKLEGAVRNRDGTTYVPLKFIAEALGAKTKWDNENKTITITRD